MSAAKTVKSARVIVIGAGAAGVAAATRLVASGFEQVLLLEAENRIGGRIHTVPFADNVVDLGAQWCHGEGKNAIFELLQRKQLDLLESTGSIYDDFKCIRSNQEVLSDRDAGQLKAIADRTMPDRLTELQHYEGSLGAYLTEKFWQEYAQLGNLDRSVAREFLDNFKKYECSVEASDNLFEVSGRGHLEYEWCEGDLLLNWRDKGFRSFLRVLMEAKDDAPEDLGLLNQRILFNSRVQCIDYSSEDRILIKLWNGETIEADHVICTVSLGVLKENYEAMFRPALPAANCRAIEGLKLGTVNKFFLEFDEPFGPADWASFVFLWRDEELAGLKASKYFWLESVFGFFRVSFQPRIIGGWIVGPHGRHMETLPQSEVREAVLWLLRKFLKFPVPEPKNFLRTRWYTNPNFRGSYTYRSLYTDELRTGAWELGTPVTSGSGTPRLQFAGESTHQKYYSTVHGAVESGWREAERLLGYYRERPTSHL